MHNITLQHPSEKEAQLAFNSIYTKQNNIFSQFISFQWDSNGSSILLISRSIKHQYSLSLKRLKYHYTGYHNITLY